MRINSPAVKGINVEQVVNNKCALNYSMGEPKPENSGGIYAPNYIAKIYQETCIERCREKCVMLGYL